MAAEFLLNPRAEEKEDVLIVEKKAIGRGIVGKETEEEIEQAAEEVEEEEEVEVEIEAAEIEGITIGDVTIAVN